MSEPECSYPDWRETGPPQGSRDRRLRSGPYASLPFKFRIRTPAPLPNRLALARNLIGRVQEPSAELIGQGRSVHVSMPLLERTLVGDRQKSLRRDNNSFV